MPFFSVIIPTYNRAKFLDRTIQSVLNQSEQDFELIIVDDGSTDNTKELVSKYITQHKHISYVYQENKERAVARNKGLTRAQGQYAVFLDSDDFFYPNHLEVLKMKIKANPHIRVFATKSERLKNGVKLIPSSLSKKKEGLYIYRDFLQENFISCNLCILRLGTNYFNEDKAIQSLEDWQFVLQNTYDKPLLLINDATYCIDDHSERSMNKSFDQIITASQYLKEWLKSNLLTEKEDVKISEGGLDYFTAVYYRLSGRKKQALNYWFKSFRNLGFSKKIIMLFLKIVFK